jgi:DNA-binding NarL/FixJ family response regulator
MTEVQNGRPVNIVILSEDHITRSGLHRILESQPGFSVLGEGSLGSTGLIMPLLLQRPLILLDLDPNGADALHKLEELTRSTSVIVLCDLGHDELTRKALNLGAAGIVLKSQPPSVLIAVIQSVNENAVIRPQGRNHEPERTSKDGCNVPVNPPQAHDRIDSLTARERDIIRLIAAGLRNKEVAHRLHISDVTVRHHLTSIFSKLNVPDRQNLLIVAHQNGIVEFTPAQEGRRHSHSH